MGFIYKVTNPNNNKCYIGKTTRNYKDRWAEHKRDRVKEPYKTWHFYRMLNTVGPENVTWEVIEEVPNDKIDEREQYWITYYDSFKNGYNETSGGSKGTKYDYNEVLNYWLNEGERNFVKTGKYFNADQTTIAYIIKSFGYEARASREVNSCIARERERHINKIDLKTGKVLATYNNCNEAALDLGNKTYARTVWTVANGKKPSYRGFGWQYTEDIGKPIILNKQIKSLFLPELNLLFDTKSAAAKWFIENKLDKKRSINTVLHEIHNALINQELYYGLRLEEKEKIIYTYYDKEEGED